MIRYIRMMKSGSTSVTEWLRGIDKPDGHEPAWRVRDRHPDALLWGTIRPPLDWYRSWHSHLQRAYGGRLSGGSVARSWGKDFKSALYAFTHGVVPLYDPMKYEKHLYNPAGWFLNPVSPRSVALWGDEPPGLWSRAVEWMFRDGDGWAVDALVPADMAQGFLEELYPQVRRDLNRLNQSPDLGITFDDDMIRWVREADGGMIKSIRDRFGISVRFHC